MTLSPGADASPAVHTVAWFRRDLRLADNPALLDALAAEATLPLFVLDPVLWDVAGAPRRAYLTASLRALDVSVRSLSEGAGLCVLRGDPVTEVVAAARAVGASRVHVARDFGPYGAARDEAVEQALAEHGIELVRTGSPYAVAPGRVRSGGGTPYKVFTPFSKAWIAHGWRAPVAAPTTARWLELEGVGVPEAPAPDGMELPEAGEAAALRRWRDFLDEAVAGYDTEREIPGRDGSSRMSVHLKWGEIHPRTMLADLAALPAGSGPATYRKELAWREFYADVLHARPETARESLRPEFARMDWDGPAGDFDAWREGRTGFPIVDAGMRQLRETGWMHNRVRMIVASFLVKDLHVDWRHGARHFMQWLVDGDLASNQHNWQWVAGSGTDASPFFRVFNPTGQGRKFDPDGRYVRRWVPELADAADPHAPTGVPGYPAPVVDHAEERREALRRWERIRT
ncbi:cryptochrome/photolyase family protein [Nocardioides pacificus]